MKLVNLLSELIDTLRGYLPGHEVQVRIVARNSKDRVTRTVNVPIARVRFDDGIQIVVEQSDINEAEENQSHEREDA